MLKALLLHVFNGLLLAAGIVIGVIVGVTTKSWTSGLLVAAVIVLVAIALEVVAIVRFVRKGRQRLADLVGDDPFASRGNTWGGLLGKRPANDADADQPRVTPEDN